MTRPAAWVAAASRDFRTRQAAAEWLASDLKPDDEGTKSILRRLLQDPDLAVTRSTFKALLQRNDLLGHEVVFSVLPHSNPQHLDTMFSELPALRIGEGIPVTDMAELALRTSNDADVLAGAQNLLSWLED